MIKYSFYDKCYTSSSQELEIKDDIDTISIANNLNLKTIIINSPKVKNINIEHSPNLVELKCNYDNIHTLIITDCNKLNKLPTNITNITNLELNYTNINEIPNNLSKLECLLIDSCPIKKIPKELTTIKGLKLNNCLIKQLPDELINIVDLYIYNCEHFKELSN